MENLTTEVMLNATLDSGIAFNIGNETSHVDLEFFNTTVRNLTSLAITNNIYSNNRITSNELLNQYDTLSRKIAMGIIGAVIVIINLIVVLTSGLIVKKGIEPRCTYLLLGNLALIDMVIGAVGIFVTMFFEKLSRLNLIGCILKIAIYNSTMIVSIYTVMMIAVDRFLYILHGLKYNQLLYPKRARLIIALIWLFGILIGLLPAFGWSNKLNEGQLCLFIEFVPHSLIITLAVIATIPIPIILLLYGIILMSAFNKIGQTNNGTTHVTVQQGREPSEMRTFKGGSITTISSATSDSFSSGYCTENSTVPQRNDQSHTNVSRAISTKTRKWKAFKVVLFTTSGYIFTWIPGCVINLMITLCDDATTPDKCRSLQNVAVYTTTLSFMNCFLNPIIYAWWHKGFRKAAKRIFNKKKKTIVEWWEYYHR